MYVCVCVCMYVFHIHINQIEFVFILKEILLFFIILIQNVTSFLQSHFSD